VKPASEGNGLITWVTELGLRHPWRVLGAASVVTAISVWLASGLEIRSSFEELLPSDVPSVVHVKELVRRVGGDGTVLVSIEALQAQDGLAHAEAMAKELAHDFLALGPLTIRSVQWNMGSVERWYSDHWPMFLSLDELEKARDALKTYLAKVKAKANPLLLHLDDEPEAPPVPGAQIAPWLDPKTPLPREQIEARFSRYRNGFLVHSDGRSVTLVVRPTGTALGVAQARQLIDGMRAIVDRRSDQLKSQHLWVGFGGTFPLFVAEYEAILNDVASTAIICLSLVLGSLFLFYRDLRSTLALGISVIGAVALTFGLTRLVIGYLNTQTAFLGAIVVGNGINYGLIYLARLHQLRGAGIALGPACIEGARTSASATLLASAASSVSFGVLIIAANRGFRHFGFIGGIGMLLCWVFTFALVPALLSILERVSPAKPSDNSNPEPSQRVKVVFERLTAHPRWVVGIFAALTVASTILFVRQLPRALERNLDNLTNELRGDSELLRDNDRAQNSLGTSIAGTLALLPSEEEADAFCDVVRERQKQPRWASLIQGCETASSVVPRHQAEKLNVIRDIQRMLSDRVLEHLPQSQRDRLRQVKADLAAQTSLSIDQAPPTLLDRFRERDGTVGRIAVVTARGDAKLEQEQNLVAFVQAVRNIRVNGKTYEGAGENVVFADLLVNIEREGPLTTLLSLLGVCILVVILFRSARASVLVIGSLVTGVILMGGVGALLGLKINFFNFIVFPITFGIAVDYGANVVARIRERGAQVLQSMIEVGPAVALCSWTSIIGYGSLLFSLNRALRSFGWYAMVGEVTTIICALVLLPSLRLLVPPKAGLDKIAA
jgi:predicted RND superfamily exporter protein